MRCRGARRADLLRAAGLQQRARAEAIEIARQTIAAFEGFDYIVISLGLLRRHGAQALPRALKTDAVWGPRAKALAPRTYELVSFLVDIRGMTEVEVSWPAKAAYHDSCSGLRELGVREQPRKLLKSVARPRGRRGLRA